MQGIDGERRLDKMNREKPAEVPQSEGDVNLSSARDAWQREHLNDATRAMLEEDARYFLHQSLSTPCLNVLEHCEGSVLVDMQGRRYLDFHGNNVHQVGFGHPKVKAAISEALENLPFCTRRYTNRYAIALARKLAQLAPGNLNKCLFAPGGAEAISMAVKLARMATGRFKTISMWDSFHGATLDTISLGGEFLFRNGIGPLLAGADYVEYVLRKEGDVAALVAETVRSTGTIPPVQYWQQLRALCDRYGVLLILDEIPHGLGRTGSMFTCQQYGIIPDMLVIGKGLGGGSLPLAALIAREDLDVARDRALGHFTHEKNPVLCASALATLEIIESEQLPLRAQKLGDHFRSQLRALQPPHGLLSDVRGMGLMTAITLNRPDGTPADTEAEQMMYAALSRGLSFKTSMGNVLVLTPPLTIAEEELQSAVSILEMSFSTL
jgi:4-aminobutyrate aminotransferase